MSLRSSSVQCYKRQPHTTAKHSVSMLFTTQIGAVSVECPYITMGGLVPWTPKFTTRIVLSWLLLAWMSMEGRIPSSFTNFITTPEFSGPLHISPDMYHTQITEYSLHTIDQ
jgi:hypothetical protein